MLLKWSIWVIVDFIYNSLSSVDFNYIFIYFLEARYPELRAEYWAFWKYMLILQHAGDFFPGALYRLWLSNMTKQKSCC